MFERIFSQPSGRVVAVARLSLAAVFLIATMTEPSISPRAAIDLVLAAYLVFAAVAARAIWNDWWVDTRTAAAIHIIDIVFFMIVVLHRPEGYASPYFLFFVFLLLSAAIRWGWRATAWTAAAVIPLYGP